MTDTALTLTVIYFAGLITIVICGSLYRNDFSYDPEARRKAAQVILSAPVWPVMVVVLFLRHVPRYIGQLFQDALGPRSSDE